MLKTRGLRAVLDYRAALQAEEVATSFESQLCSI